MKERFCINFNRTFLDENREFRMKAIKDAGFPTVHLCSNAQGHFDVQRKYIDEFCELCAKIGIAPVNYHAPFLENDKLWVEGAERDSLLDDLIKETEYVGKAGMKSIIVHPTTGIPNLYVSEIGIDSFKKLTEAGEKSGVTVCIENLRTHKHLDYLFNAIDSPYLGFCHDTGHEFAFTKGMDYALRYKGRMAYTHIHDNDAIGDLHLVPGKALLDWDHLLWTYKEADYQGPLSLELAYNDSLSDFESVVNEGYKALVKYFGE